MALRPLAFGVRLRDASSGRTLRVKTREHPTRRFVVEESRRDRRPRKRAHASLASALADAASAWRKRLH